MTNYIEIQEIGARMLAAELARLRECGYEREPDQGRCNWWKKLTPHERELRKLEVKERDANGHMHWVIPGWYRCLYCGHELHSDSPVGHTCSQCKHTRGLMVMHGIRMNRLSGYVAVEEFFSLPCPNIDKLIATAHTSGEEPQIEARP